MSQNNHGGGKNGEFVIDIDDDEDDFGFSSGDEVEISEDQRIMDEMIQRERNHMIRNAQRLRRSQTEENTLINSKNIASHSTTKSIFRMETSIATSVII